MKFYIFYLASLLLMFHLTHRSISHEPYTEMAFQSENEVYPRIRSSFKQYLSKLLWHLVRYCWSYEVNIDANFAVSKTIKHCFLWEKIPYKHGNGFRNAIRILFHRQWPSSGGSLNLNVAVQALRMLSAQDALTRQLLRIRTIWKIPWNHYQ